jgi:1-acyl-sn-glycerol-3-phosphate acyltransferase
VVYLLAVWSAALVLLGPVAGLLMLVLPRGRPIRTLSRVASRIALWMSGCRVHVEGAEHVPRHGPVVLVTNHTSYADTPVLAAALPIDFLFVAMKEILSWHVIGQLVRRGRHLTVDRWHSRQSVADAATIEQHLREGDAVLFFAEGGFSRARGLRPFRLGAFEAAVATGAPVIPIALRGSREILPADAKLPHPARVHVWVGAPIRPTSRDWTSIVALRDRAAEAIAAHCGEPRLAPAVSSRSDDETAGVPEPEPM